LLSFTGDSGLIAQVESTRLALDSLEINSRSGSGRRMLDDSTLRVATSSVAAKVSALRADIRARVAPLRRGAPSDSAGARSAALARLDTALTMLLQDIRRRPWRYVSF